MVTVAQLQLYLNDTSTDPTLVGFYQSLIDIATDRVLQFLDRTFTASASRTDVFWGDDQPTHRLHDAAQAVTAWTYIDLQFNTTTMGTSDLELFENGNVVASRRTPFISGVEHHLSYTLPSSLVLPPAVAQVIVEDAAIMFGESNQGTGTLAELIVASREGSLSDRIRFSDLSERHKETLRMYKRYPV